MKSRHQSKEGNASELDAAQISYYPCSVVTAHVTQQLYNIALIDGVVEEGFTSFPGIFLNYFDRKTTPQFAICIVAAHITKQLLSLTAGMTHCSGLASFTLSLWVVSPLSTVFLQLF